MKNKPYVKKYDDKGNVIDPVTKHRPYFSIGPNRSQRKAGKLTRHRGNNRGNAIVVVGSLKYFKTFQVVPENTIFVKKTKEYKVIPSRTIEHSVSR